MARFATLTSTSGSVRLKYPMSQSDIAGQRSATPVMTDGRRGATNSLRKAAGEGRWTRGTAFVSDMAGL